MVGTMIGRLEAFSTIQELLTWGALSEKYETALADIATAIEGELCGLHVWGAPSKDVAALNTTMRADLPGFDEFIQHQRELVKKYSFEASEFEKTGGESDG